MSDLSDVFNKLLAMDNPDEALDHADYLLQQARKIRDRFVLTKDCKWMLPIFEFYIEDEEGWYEFLRQVRDQYEWGSEMRKRIQALQTTVHTRNVQRRSRALIAAATEIAVRTGKLEDVYEAKMRYVKRCNQEWAKLRKARLESLRAAKSGKRLTDAERSEALSDFWSDIENDVMDGKIPIP